MRAKMVNGVFHRNEERESDMNISKKVDRMGTDLGKNTFHVFGVDESGLPAVRKKLRRK